MKVCTGKWHRVLVIAEYCPGGFLDRSGHLVTIPY